MAGTVELDALLANMDPILCSEEFVFCTIPTSAVIPESLQPFAVVREEEGTTLVLQRAQASAAGLQFDGEFRRITLQVHSSLSAVGLTAAVSARLTACGISANVIAAYYHDHVFVPAVSALPALHALTELAASQRSD